MAFTRVRDILKMVDTAKTSVIGFNCLDYSTAYAAINVAEELHKPVICMLYPEHVTKENVCDLTGFAAMVRDLAEQVQVPVGLHLDHCSDYAYIMQAIQSGFTSVMYDGSMLPLEENIANCRKVVETAHLFGVDVEAELGQVGMAADGNPSEEDLYTQPETAALFASETQIDSLAIAIGSAHGVYTSTPHLDLARLDAINKATSVPLVLHGGSGIPDSQLEQAFKRGINKFNVGTEFLQLWCDSFYKHCGKPGMIPVEVPALVQADLQAYLRKKMQLTQINL